MARIKSIDKIHVPNCFLHSRWDHSCKFHLLDNTYKHTYLSLIPSHHFQFFGMLKKTNIPTYKKKQWRLGMRHTHLSLIPSLHCRFFFCMLEKNTWSSVQKKQWRLGTRHTHLIRVHQEEEVVQPHDQCQERHDSDDQEVGRESQVAEEAQGGAHCQHHQQNTTQGQGEPHTNLSSDGPCGDERILETPAVKPEH